MIKNRAKTKETEYKAIKLQLSAMSRNRVRNAAALYPGWTINFDNFLPTPWLGRMLKQQRPGFVFFQS